MESFRKQAHYGSGIEWADTLEEEILEHLNDDIGVVELIPENFFFEKGKRFLKSLRDADTAVLIHAVELSIGSAEPLKQVHLDRIKRVADQVNTINISDHLCMTEFEGVEIGQLTPLPWNQENADIVCRKVEQIQSQIDVPFQIENVTNRFVVPDTELSETEFINQILHKTGCDLLLDLNNVHTNATNYKYDPYEWIEALDLSYVQGIHIAGGFYDDDGTLVDSHSAKAPQEVWDLFRFVLDRIEPEATIVEWTDKTPPVEVVMSDVRIAQEILNEKRAVRAARHAAAAPTPKFLEEVAR